MSAVGRDFVAYLADQAGADDDGSGAAKSIDLSQETKKCTLEVIGVTAFGYNFGCFKNSSEASKVGQVF